MSRLYACVFFVMAITYEAWGQVSSICRPNERLLPCGGCQKTCSDPAPACDAVCRMGCYCNDDEVRNSTGHCIKLADCPPNRMETASSMLRSTTQQGSLRRSSYASWLDNYSKLNDDNQISSEGVDAMDALAAYKRETTEPRPSPPCPENEEYRFCEPCNRTCDNPNNVCPAQCARGCFCKGELVRDADGKCVEFQYCSKFRKYEMSNFVDPIPYRIVCGPYQRYKKCETCEKTCSNPNPSCPNECKKGCFCENGLVKSPSGDCVKLKDCPKGTEY